MRRLGGRATRARTALSVALVGVTLAPLAGAAEPDGSSLSRAHDAYARGAAAYAVGDYTRAARELAFADALVPDDVTLKAALDAVTLADDPVLGVELIERSTRVTGRALPPPIAHSVAVAEARFAHRTGRIVVRCDGCLALVDGSSVVVGVPRVVLVGVHQVALQAGASPEDRLVTVGADETREVAPGAEPSVPSSIAAEAKTPLHEEAQAGVSPAWFVAAAAVTVGLGVGTILSGVSTANDHDRFVSAGCQSTGGTSCTQLASTGESAQTSTRWLGVGTAVAVAGTAALGIFGVRWHRVGGGTVSAHLAGATAVVDVSF
jgi:hypothetical protein